MEGAEAERREGGELLEPHPWIPPNLEMHHSLAYNHLSSHQA